MERGTEAKSSANGKLFKLYFIHATSSLTIAPDIYIVRVVNIPTLYTFPCTVHDKVYVHVHLHVPCTCIHVKIPQSADFHVTISFEIPWKSDDS